MSTMRKFLMLCLTGFLFLIVIIILIQGSKKSHSVLYETIDGEPITSPFPESIITSRYFSFFDWCYALELAEGVKDFGCIFKDNDQLTKIVVPACISSISDSAFMGCNKLSQVELPENILIGKSAFERCSSLEEFEFPDEVFKIDNCVFKDCSNLKKIKLSAYVNEIGVSAFSDCLKLDSVILPENLATIHKFAFENCKKLSTITLPKNLVNVSDNAFNGCDNLKSVIIQCNKIGKCFSNLYNLNDIVITNPNNIINIAENAFIGTKWFENQPAGLLYYENLLLGYKDDNISDSLIIQEGCNNLPTGLFKNCDKIRFVEIPSSIKRIPDSMFLNCVNLEYVNMHDKIECIGAYSFSNCDAINNIIIPCNVKSIGDYAFSDCCNLTNVEIPSNVTSIGNFAFYRCGNLLTVELPDTMSNVGNGAFSGCEKIETVKIPYSIAIINESTFSGCKNLKEVELSPSVKLIKTLAFADCENLAKINISDTIVDIENLAFSESNKLDYKLRAEIRIKSIKYGRVLYSDLQSKNPYIVYIDGDSICCEKYYPSNTKNEIIYKESEKFIVIKQRLGCKNKIIYKQEKDTLFLSGKLHKEKVFYKDKCVAFTTTSGSNYIINIDSPGILYEVDGFVYEEDDFNPYIYNDGVSNREMDIDDRISLWDLPGFYKTFSNYDRNACVFCSHISAKNIAHGCAGPYERYSYTLFLDKNGDVIKTKTLIGIDGEDIPISYLGTSKITPHYIKAIKKIIEEAKKINGYIPQMIPIKTSVLDLHEQCKNEIKEKELIGKLFEFNVTVKKINYNHNSSYRYYIKCTDEFNTWAWLTGGEYTIVKCDLYSDDYSFGEQLSPPCQVRVKGKFNGVDSWGDLEFVGCELISY